MNNETQCVLYCSKKREGGNKDIEEGRKERGERYKIEDTHTHGVGEMRLWHKLVSNLILFPCLFIWRSTLPAGKVFHNRKSWFWEFFTDNFIGWFCLRDLSRRFSMGHLNSNTQAGLSFITWHWEVFSMVPSQCGTMY